MDDSKGLDDLISGEGGAVASGGDVGQQRPKLRKIKRPKIRPQGMPAAPQKVYSESNIGVSDGDINAIEEQPFEKEASTSLVTRQKAQDLAYQADNNAFITDTSSQELDFGIDEDYAAEEEAYFGHLYSRKKLIIAGISCFIIGLFFGNTFLGSRQEVKQGLEGVVLNSDVPTGRPRCGLTEKSQACVFYVMNCYKQELTGRDFFKLAATMTGREEYMIEADNMRYTTTKIMPGWFAQLNIPALK